MNELERQLEENWKINAGAWANSVRLQQIESRKVSTDHAVVNEIISLQPNKILDVGCGEGAGSGSKRTRHRGGGYGRE